MKSSKSTKYTIAILLIIAALSLAAYHRFFWFEKICPDLHNYNSQLSSPQEQNYWSKECVTMEVSAKQQDWIMMNCDYKKVTIESRITSQ
ncbi:hypothetical protein IPJ72_00160 [Candidatus Peregrinibacteria bacterium]|nr:MAG: hypothetical protein IPJ72_00160 [Candidatus Peregrinibacteria bacterium]